ncbi:MAG: tRNA (N(6)-L-threonylcarbamoyladenosine(37)-C(2))-methylthiotransferase MtaB [Clostridia bacterium]|nr:tRNA (N(6)-L-threonylcarbamoyladenosine(37)-C(2))-methylthiotransferase MtaB [Clostridia bacterium]
MPTVAFQTLGCKVNQYDTQAMLECFERAGYKPVHFDGPADVYVVNTCTVTDTGDRKSMNAVRRAQRRNPDAEIVIAGCLAQRDGEKLLSTGARLVIGANHRAEVVDLLETAVREHRQIVAVGNILRVPFEPLQVSGDEGHTRAVMKIQEGCDRYCTYCIIPYVRGGIRSRALEDIRAEALRLREAGYRELVLTGIHLTSYGRDLEGADLADAVEAAASSGVERLRLGSLEPVIASEVFIGRIRQIPSLCPQFHLALQSGSDAVLKRMRRRYTAQEFREAADRLYAAFPGCAITTDIITGFPGETEADFEQTCALVRGVRFARIHVFPYSARKGTPAAAMPDQLPRAVREERARTLIHVGRETAAAWAETQLGRVRPVLVEDQEDGFYRGYTPEYAPVLMTGVQPGTLVDVRLDEWTGTAFRGTCVS